MKRGMDEKSMGPMFPRLHVNNTEKGGPRAPPRNKMALYEQLSIPSQRLSGGILPFNPNSTANYTPPPSSSSQGGANERGSYFSLQQIPLMHDTDKANNRYVDFNNQLVQLEQKKNQEDEEFMVPLFDQQSGVNLDRSRNHQKKDDEGHTSFRQSNKVQSKETNGSASFGHRNPSNNSIRLQSNGNSQDHVVDSQANKNVRDNSVSNTIRTAEYGNSLLPIREVEQDVLRSPNDPINGDAVSETSMVDSMYGVDISPDDVVGIIGQKHFWKARRAIINQQRVFAVQVFELHRLIKVQRLIAGTPPVVVEEDVLTGKPAKVSSPIKKIPLDRVLKSSTNVPKLKDYHEKSKDATREFSADNAVEKGSHSSVQNSSRSTFSGYPLPSDPRMGPWSLNHPTGHQWLIPVMSPSEGLIYKPYPGPGYMSPGPGPPGSAPIIGHNFVNHGTPRPAQSNYQRPTWFHPLIPVPAHGYFPPYGMTTMNASSSEEIMNPFNMQYQSSPNVPPVGKFHASNNSEVQVSTASSQSNRTPDQDALPLFPTCSPAAGGAQPARVIRVVPRKAQSATESVGQIFQSIQDERKQQDPV